MNQIFVILISTLFFGMLSYNFCISIEKIFNFKSRDFRVYVSLVCLGQIIASFYLYQNGWRPLITDQTIFILISALFFGSLFYSICMFLEKIFNFENHNFRAYMGLACVLCILGSFSLYEDGWFEFMLFSKLIR